MPELRVRGERGGGGVCEGAGARRGGGEATPGNRHTGAVHDLGLGRAPWRARKPDLQGGVLLRRVRGGWVREQGTGNNGATGFCCHSWGYGRERGKAEERSGGGRAAVHGGSGGDEGGICGGGRGGRGTSYLGGGGGRKEKAGAGRRGRARAA